MKRLVSGIVLMLLLMAMSSLAFYIKPVKGEWTGTVYIRADGSIDPPDAPIITHDNVTYTLTNNITCSVNGVIIERNDIVFDGNGFTILGPSRGFGIVWYGMIIENVNNVSIVNVTVTNFFIGIYFNNSSYNKILECGIINNARGINFDFYCMFNMVHKSVVRGNSQYGIVAGDGSNNNVISENFIEDNLDGVCLYTSNNSILRNTIANNYFEGIRLEGDNNNVFENTILYHYYPGILVMGSHNLVCNNTLNASIQIYSSLDNTVSGNHVTDFGIFLTYSSYNTLRNNSMDNFEIRGTKLEHFINDIDVSNIIKGKPIYYFVNRNNESIVVKEAECGYFALINSTNIDLKVLGVDALLAFIQNSTITESNAGFEVISSSRCAFSRNKGGISMWESLNNYVSENNLSGLYLHCSAFNRVYANVIYYFIQLYSSSNNNIARNKVYGIELSGSSNNYIIENGLKSIELYGSSNNIIRGNNITNNREGIYLEDSSNNSIIGNYIANQVYGISVWNSSNNSIYHNKFINNYHHVFDWSWLYPSELPPSLNTWDDGYPSGGNYWSDYQGDDLYSGPYQNETGSDGIGDIPYIIDENNVDHYPLVVTPTVDAKPDVLNLGVKGEWVTVYIELPEGYNVSDIDVSSIRLNGTIPVDINAPTAIGDYDNDGIPDLMVKFNRTAVCQLILSKGIMVGNVTLTVSGKLIDGVEFEGYDIIRVRMPGDLNMDGKVDLKDISIASRAFGSYLGHERWNQMADENEDDKIDLKDIALICRNFGKTY